MQDYIEIFHFKFSDIMLNLLPKSSDHSLAILHTLQIKFPPPFLSFSFISH